MDTLNFQQADEGSIGHNGELLCHIFLEDHNDPDYLYDLDKDPHITFYEEDPAYLIEELGVYKHIDEHGNTIWYCPYGGPEAWCTFDEYDWLLGELRNEGWC